jgi:hypothetical protein
MTNEQLTAYLQDETYLYSVSYEELKTLVMQYPYSANLRILLLKKSFLDQNKDYDRNLQMSATYGTNRKHLYKTIKKLKSFKLVPQNVILGEDYLELTELSNIERLLAERQVTEALSSDTKAATLAQDWQLEIDDIAFNEEPDKAVEAFDLSDLNQKSDNSKKKNRTEEDEIDSLINSLVTQYKIPALDLTPEALAVESEKDDLVIHSTHSDVPDTILEFEEEENEVEVIESVETQIEDEDIIIEEELNLLAAKEDFETPNIEVAVPNIKEETIKIPEEVLPIQHIEETDIEENESEEDVKKSNIELEIINQTKAPLVESVAQISSSDKKPSFTEWLSQFRMTGTTGTPVAVHPSASSSVNTDNQTVTPPIVDEVVRKTSRESMVGLFETENEVPDNLFGLVEKRPKIQFLENDNSYDDDDDDDDEIFSDDDEDAPKKKKKRPMHQLAVKSLVQDDELVSETLADLIAWQGNSKKAIEMYRKLILRFPEKSAYFATKIEKISN